MSMGQRVNSREVNVPYSQDYYTLYQIFVTGMMIETMAGKSSALHRLCHDCTPFTFSEDKPAIKHFGKLLVQGTRCIRHFNGGGVG